MSNSSQKISYIKVKDHSVSGEEFELLINDRLGMLETFPRPCEERLPGYYKSEDYISHTDAKRNIFERVYHLVKSIALKRKLKLIDKLAPSSRLLLDVGCGTGDFLKIASTSGWEITGVEPDDQARAIANYKTRDAVCNTNQLFLLQPNSFDVITLWHVLEHLPKLEHHFTTFKKLLKPDGRLVIAVPNYKSYDAQLYKEFWAAYDVPRHLWHFSQDAIKTLCIEADMDVVEILPMTFDAFYVSLLSEKYKSGKMNYFKGFWNGWRSNRLARVSGEYSSLIYVIKKN